MDEYVTDPTAAPGLPRRQLLKLGGLAGVAAVATPLLRQPSSGPALQRQPDVAGAPMADQLHLQFGADTARTMVASWSTPVPVRRPRLRLGTPSGGYGRVVDADVKTYTEGITGETVWTYHATIDHLHPDTDYRYEVFADGAHPVDGSFRTAPDGRAPFRFTSFGDQAIPAAVGSGAQPGPHTPNAGYIVDALTGLDRAPLFHLLNGDLCYANVSDDPVATWRSFFSNNMRAASRFPWMPCAGNHENEVGNGPEGYRGYQTWFTLPDNDQPDDYQGNWYSFKAGSVGVVSLNNDDVCYQQGSFSPYRQSHLVRADANRDDYIRGYSHGAQKAWLDRTLGQLRADDDIDWIVVCMHQVAMSSANFNGADLGVREEWLPLFDRHGVDLVVAGHEHHYERSHPVRGASHANHAPTGKDLLTPLAASGSGATIDTTKGTVHMILGGGGHSSATPPSSFDDDTHGVVIYDVGAPVNGNRASLKVTDEPSHWSAHRDLVNEYGFGVFDVDPGRPGGTTSITFTYYGTTAGSATYRPLDTVTLTRPR
ncbi:MAG: uncharacterized protein JWN29_3802 [Acidimicrobiales bacterium]|nr:uncharacterized protein [Acidimicrobiales bacterium]